MVGEWRGLWRVGEGERELDGEADHLSVGRMGEVGGDRIEVGAGEGDLKFLFEPSFEGRPIEPCALDTLVTADDDAANLEELLVDPDDAAGASLDANFGVGGLEGWKVEDLFIARSVIGGGVDGLLSAAGLLGIELRDFEAVGGG